MFTPGSTAPQQSRGRVRLLAAGRPRQSPRYCRRALGRSLLTATARIPDLAKNSQRNVRHERRCSAPLIVKGPLTLYVAHARSAYHQRRESELHSPYQYPSRTVSAWSVSINPGLVPRQAGTREHFERAAPQTLLEYGLQRAGAHRRQHRQHEADDEKRRDELGQRQKPPARARAIREPSALAPF